MSKYAAYDARLLGLIHSGCDTFDALCRKLAEVNKALETSPGDGFRVTDRRLQALRKAGRIIFNRSRGTWHAVQPTE